jgi:hypothetical protein
MFYNPIITRAQHSKPAAVPPCLDGVRPAQSPLGWAAVPFVQLDWIARLSRRAKGDGIEGCGQIRCPHGSTPSARGGTALRKYAEA